MGILQNKISNPVLTLILSYNNNSLEKIHFVFLYKNKYKSLLSLLKILKLKIHKKMVCAFFSFMIKSL